MMEEVKVWLKDQGLENLTDLFLSQGFDELFIISQLDEARIEELGINKLGVKMKLLDRINKLKSNSNLTSLIPTSHYPVQTDLGPVDNMYSSAVPYYRPPNLVLTPDRSKGRLYGRGPYRCNLCCELKIRDTETKTKHICKSELIGHRWEDCPTRYLANHPEALAKLKEEKKEAKRLKKEEKKKEKDLQRWQPQRKKRKEPSKEEDDVQDPGVTPDGESHLTQAALAQIEKIRQHMKLIVDNPMHWTERMETDNVFLTLMLSLYEHLTSYTPHHSQSPDSEPSSPSNGPSSALLTLQNNVGMVSGTLPPLSNSSGSSVPRPHSPPSINMHSSHRPHSPTSVSMHSVHRPHSPGVNLHSGHRPHSPSVSLHGGSGRPQSPPGQLSQQDGSDDHDTSGHGHDPDSDSRSHSPAHHSHSHHTHPLSLSHSHSHPHSHHHPHPHPHQHPHAHGHTHSHQDDQVQEQDPGMNGNGLGQGVLHGHNDSHSLSHHSHHNDTHPHHPHSHHPHALSHALSHSHSHSHQNSSLENGSHDGSNVHHHPHLEC